MFNLNFKLTTNLNPNTTQPVILLFSFSFFFHPLFLLSNDFYIHYTTLHYALPNYSGWGANNFTFYVTINYDMNHKCRGCTNLTKNLENKINLHHHICL